MNINSCRRFKYYCSASSGFGSGLRAEDGRRQPYVVPVNDKAEMTENLTSPIIAPLSSGVPGCICDPQTQRHCAFLRCAGPCKLAQQLLRATALLSLRKIQ